MKILINLMLLFVLSLSSCTSLTKEDCQNNNWKDIGERDAKNGRARSVFQGYQKSCIEQGVKIKQDEYDVGFKIGLMLYCTYENGYEVGSVGKSNPQTCPNDTLKNFSQGYIAGKKWYEQKLYYEQELRLREENSQRHAQMRERVMGNSQQLTCHWNSDCVIKSKCFDNKCSASGIACRFDSNCDIEGTCNNEKCQF